VNTRYIFQIILLALSYFATGKLGLLLAIPPGYATAVWPASGIALAALLLYGRHLWPGIVLGSFLVNVATSFDSSSTLSILKSLALAGNIGLGAALQALLGHWLINRFVDTSDGLVDARSATAFLSLGGPAACLLNAFWSVTTLWLAGLVSSTEYPYSTATWWVGDAIGVIIFLPLIYAWLGKPVEVWHWRRSRLVPPLIATIAIVIGLFIYTSRLEQQRIQSDFTQQAQTMADALDKKFGNYLEILHSIESFVLTTPQLNGEIFRAFTQRSLERNSGIQAVSWNPRVSIAERGKFEAAMIEEGYSDFAIRERNAEGQLVSAADYPNHIVVQYIEPYRDNYRAQGFDVYSDELRRTALDTARDRATPVATARITLVQESGKQSGMLVFLPVYDPASPQAGKSARHRKLMGFVVGVFRLGDMLLSTFSGMPIRDVQVQLTDESADVESQHLVSLETNTAAQPSLIAPYASDTSITWSTGFDFHGRNWRLEITPTQKYISDTRSWSSWGMLAGGLSLTGLFGLFLLVLTGRTIIEARHGQQLGKINDLLKREIEQRKQVQKQLHDATQHLHQLATTDPLTGVLNRRQIEQIGIACDAEVRRYQQPYTAIMLDADHFKQINDQYGHEVGDQVLKSLTRIMGLQLRETDRLGRWGGEEFVVLASNTDVNEGVELANRLCRVIGATNIRTVGKVTVSVGVASSEGLNSYREVIKRADEAMYLAKTSGRNRVVSADRPAPA
jgi:diguanylate cyclase (GGDEF)-like protein